MRQIFTLTCVVGKTKSLPPGTTTLPLLENIELLTGVALGVSKELFTGVTMSKKELSNISCKL